MIIGIGIDIVRVDRIEKAVKRWSGSFTSRVFTDGELEYCKRQKRPALHLAARFGAKEAVMKAFGTGHSGGVKWTDIEVLNDESGRPIVTLSGVLKELAEGMGVAEAMISMSHDSAYAVSQAILTGGK